MCGIAAEIRFSDVAPDHAAVARMTAALQARGPDGEGFWSDGRRVVGHRRLTIIDLSERGAQPMSDEELGLTVAFNGCIYNYRELRDELSRAGYSFFSSSDTEVILKGYHHWGEGLLERLLGMFAFVLCEGASGRTVLVRDRLGVKPLYLAEIAGGAGLRIASTLPALLAGGGISGEIDPVALHHYLSWHSVVPAPRTILAGVRKLAPASILTLERDGTRSERSYWEPRFGASGGASSADGTGEEPVEDLASEEWPALVREGLRKAVDRRMVADVPVGVLLSGGIDSSLIVGLLAQAGAPGLQTFSIGFPDSEERRGDEFEFSDLVAREFATEHHRLRVGLEELAEALPEAIGAMSEPMVSHDNVAFYLLSREVARSIKVVQSGQGADEVFAGYHWYPPMDEASEARQIEAYERAFSDRDHEQIGRLVSNDLRLERSVSREFIAAHFARPGAGRPLERALRLDQQVMLAEDPVKRIDNMSMAHGLEARTPFLDHELVELAARCPAELKLAAGGKGVLKAAARGVIPDAVIDRPKGYFPVPGLVRLEGPVLELARDALCSSRARERGLWDRARVEEFLAEPNAHLTPSGANETWQIALLEQWLATHGL
jgi:asparagine synthase (glutamine-hydrolysing)